MKVKKLLLAALFTHLLFASALGQSELFLRHMRKEGKIRRINLDDKFEIRTKDTTYTSVIFEFTDSTILIPTQVRTGKDSVHTYTYSYKVYSKSNAFQVGEVKDTTVVKKTVVPLYRSGTLEIPFSDILMIKKGWFKNSRWLSPFGWMVIGSVLGVALLPVAAIDDGKEGVREWAVFEGVLLGVSLPAIFIGTRKTKYDLQKKWALEAR